MRYTVHRFFDGICNVYGHNVKYVNVLLVYYQHIEIDFSFWRQGCISKKKKQLTNL